MSCAASARFIRYAKKSPAGPPPMMAIFIFVSNMSSRAKARDLSARQAEIPRLRLGMTTRLQGSRRRPSTEQRRHIRRAQMPIGCALKRAADIEQRRFVKWFAEQLDSDRQSAERKSGRQRKRARI